MTCHLCKQEREKAAADSPFLQLIKEKLEEAQRFLDEQNFKALLKRPEESE